MTSPFPDTPDSPAGRRAARGRPFRSALRRRGGALLRAWPVRLGGLAFGLAVGLVLAGHFAVSTGAISLDAYAPALRQRVAERAGGALGFGGIRVERREGGGPIELILTDVTLAREAGQVALPDLSLTLDTGGVLRGDVLPRFVTARGGDVTLIRTRTGLRVAQAGDAAESDAVDARGAPFALASLVARASEGGFEGVRLTGATLRLRSELSDQSLVLEKARLDVWAEGEGYAAAATAPLGGGRIALRAAVDDEGPNAELLFSRVPPRALTGLFPDLPLRAARTQLSGDASLADGRLTFRLRAAPGAVETPLGPRPLRAASASGLFDLKARRLTITAADLAFGTDVVSARGTVLLNGAPRFDAEIGTLRLTPPRYEAPLPTTRGRVAGRWGGGALAYDGTLDLPGGQVALEGALSAQEVSLTLASNDPVATDTLLALWPHGVAPAARDWAAHSLRAGRARSVRFGLRLPRGAGGALARDAVTLDVEADDVALAYADGLPPVVATRGALHMDLDALTATAAGGRIGDAALRRAAVRIEGLRSAPRLAVEAVAEGTAPALLALADAPALGLLERANLSASQFDGQGRFALRLTRPLGPGGGAEQVATGEGTFGGLSVDGLPAGIVLTDADGTVHLTEDALRIDAHLDVLGVPADATLTRSLGPGGETRIVAEADLTPSDLDALGLPVRRYATGSAPTRLTLGGGARLEGGALSLDLTRAQLDVPLLGLRKAPGERGSVRLDLALPPGQPARLSGIKLVTDDVLVEGSARFDEAGGLARLELPRVFAEGHANLAAVLTRRGAGLHLAVDGRYADLSGLVSRALQGGGGGGPSFPLTLEAALDEGRLRGGAVVEGLRGTAARAVDGSFSMDLSGALGAGRVSFEVAADPDGIGREVVLAADEAGLLLEGLFGITSVEGGAARLRAVAVQDGPLAGTMRAEDVTLRDAPLVARLLSVGSLDGLAGVLNGQGLYFDEFAGDFILEEGTLGLQDVRLTGSALGLSALGEIDLGARRFDLSGAVAPAYGVNSFLGGIPGLGDLLVSRRGEGVVALGYTVAGPIAEPTVTVNTLSALTPGVFRRLFEPVRERRPSTAEVLEAATRKAASREERMTATRAEDMTEDEEAEAETPRAGGGAGARPD